ncbi:hypothetical protein VTK73DRAFT_4855 [Phialemonium thermophilum]|uniref:EKC/KEOPS complex subunit CGI121 n=1 Tax=Phialemonium thermophilum TaxID=223376 RepID=A0ABR3WRN6_9PEZI
MELETIHLEHVPETHIVYAALFQDVKNAAFLHSQLLARNTEFEYAFIDAASVVSRFHVLSAVFKALTVLLDGTLKTPNVHSEVVCSLSPSNNIAEAYRRFGIGPTTRDVIVIKISHPAAPVTVESVRTHLAAHIECASTSPLSDHAIAACTDLARVRKYYKLGGAPALERFSKRAEGEHEEGLVQGTTAQTRRELTILAVSAMALRGL